MEARCMSTWKVTASSLYVAKTRFKNRRERPEATPHRNP